MTHEITIERVFSAAHAIRLYDGSIEPLHGHDWRLAVTLGRGALDEIGVVMDFHVLEASVEGVIGPWRNQNLNDIEPFASSVNPTAELIAQYIGEQVMRDLPAEVELLSVSLGEAPGCTATWRASG